MTSCMRASSALDNPAVLIVCSLHSVSSVWGCSSVAANPATDGEQTPISLKSKCSTPMAHFLLLSCSFEQLFASVLPSPRELSSPVYSFPFFHCLAVLAQPIPLR